MPLLTAITSAIDEDVNQLSRCWINGINGEPFLFINGGAATLSSTGTGMAIIKDAVTQREIQLLDHPGICCFYLQ
jgi:hypothetical protein